MIRSAEFVFPGHPDKLSDAIADALVEAAALREKRALVGVEVAIHRDQVFITGRIACRDAESIDVQRIVREVYASAGYGRGWYPAPEEVRVTTNLCLGPLEEGEDEFRLVSDDQAICVGYANDMPETGHMPVEQWLVRHVARRLHALRTEHPGLQLGPDGKVIVVVDETPSPARADRRWRLAALSCSLQQMKTADDLALHRAVRQAVAGLLQELASQLPGLSAEVPSELHVNGAGAFEVGGPEGDNGLSGKKLVMDAFGPRVPIGGGAWSGKDFFKADRAGGLHARRLALLVVQLGVAAEAIVQLAWFPGDEAARVLSVLDGDGRLIDHESVTRLLDRSLAVSGERWSPQTGSGSSSLVETARWGHFGVDAPWEQFGQL